MIVVLAAWIEGCVTNLALKITLQVLPDGQFGTASPAKNCLLVPFTPGPNLYRMVCQSRVAIFAGVKHSAAPHLDRGDIARTAIVLAARLRIKIESTHFARF